VNCWEFKQCGREKGGVNVDHQGCCPAYPDHGKRCAFVAGTFCGGERQGSFAKKLTSCLQCDFFQSVHYDKLHGIY